MHRLSAHEEEIDPDQHDHQRAEAEAEDGDKHCPYHAPSSPALVRREEIDDGRGREEQPRENGPYHARALARARALAAATTAA